MQEHIRDGAVMAEVPVIAFFPASEAPMQAPSDAISSSI